MHYDDALGDYVEHLLSCTPNRLNGLRVVVDTGNGAAAGASPRALRRMGAEVLAIHSSPDGYNINEGCGSTHMADLREAVVEHGYDVGIAHDGDADRCLAVDAEGNVVDGDQIMAILALAMRDQGKLAQDTVVATVMSNLGFKLAMREQGSPWSRRGWATATCSSPCAPTATRSAASRAGTWCCWTTRTTGDGTLTALHLLARMADTRTPPVGAGRGDDQAAPGADQRPRTWTGPRSAAPPAWLLRWPRPRPGSARPAGCCCARAGPSRWSG